MPRRRYECLLLLAALARGPDAFAQQAETTAHCDEGTIPEPVTLEFDDSTVNCKLNAATDNDSFIFEGSAGDLVRISILSQAGGLDPRLEVIAPAGGTLQVLSCDGGSGGTCAVSQDLELPETGVYFLFLVDSGSNEAGNYLLQITRLNDNPATVVIPYDVTVGDTISPPTDVDFFSFFGRADTAIRFSLLSRSGGYDPHVEILDPLGAVVPGTGCDGGTGGTCSFTTDIPLPVDGNYQVRISDAGINENGSYVVGLWCVYGPCDSDGDGVPDPAVERIAYDVPFDLALTSQVDAAYYSFNATAGTDLRFNLLSHTGGFDPRMEVRDPSGALVLSASCDGGTGGTCGIHADFSPATSGLHTVILSDTGVNEAGSALVAVWCVSGPCDSDADGNPDPDPSGISLVTAKVANLPTQVSPAYYTFNGTAGSIVQFNLLSLSGGLDPRIEIRDPTGVKLEDRSCDGGTGGTCSLRFDRNLTADGVYELLLSDVSTNEAGSIEISARCLYGACDSDADGVVDGGHEALFYGETISDDLDARTDVNFYTLQETVNRRWTLAVLSQSGGFDPTITARDANGDVVFDGAADGAGCDGGAGGTCSFIIDRVPASTRTLTLSISDAGINEFGTYEMTLSCIGVGCVNPTVDLDADNCIEMANGPLHPDDGGNVQRDTDGDGIGNVCDADLDNDCNVNFVDLGVFKLAFFGTDPDPDLTGDGAVNFPDLGRVKELFLKPPGPSGIPNLCGQN